VSKGFFLANGGYEYNLVLGAAALSVAFSGPGALSVDSLIGLSVSGTLWGIAALIISVAGGAVQLALRRPSPAQQVATA
jgi:putative oxidoreductase